LQESLKVVCEPGKGCPESPKVVPEPKQAVCESSKVGGEPGKMASPRSLALSSMIRMSSTPSEAPIAQLAISMEADGALYVDGQLQTSQFSIRSIGSVF
jgi:hypothetical protein